MGCLNILSILLVMFFALSVDGGVQRNVVTNVKGDITNVQSGGGTQSNVVSNGGGTITNIQNGEGSQSIINAGNGYSTSKVNGITTGWCEHEEDGKKFIIHFKVKDGKLKVLDVDGDENKLKGGPVDAVKKCMEKADKDKQEAQIAHEMAMEEHKKNMDELAKNMDNMKEDMNNMFKNIFSAGFTFNQG